MKYILLNNKLPPIHSIILICDKMINMMGIIEVVYDEYMIALLLNINGRCILHKTDNWIVLNITNMESLRDNYNIYCKPNIPKLINDAYTSFSIKNFMDR